MALPIKREAFSQSQPDSHCLLCYQRYEPVHRVKTLNCAEVLTDIFQVFCKYMGWEPGPEFKYKFSSDPFPFCEDCKIVLMQIYKLHENIQGIQKQIEQFVLSASARILESEVKGAGSHHDHPEKKMKTQQKKNCDDNTWDWDSISKHYRRLILNHYSASVQLTPQDYQNVLEFAGSINVDLENDPQDQDQDIMDSVFPEPLQEPTVDKNYSEGSQDGVDEEADDDLQHSDYSANSSPASDIDDVSDSSTRVFKTKKNQKLRSLIQPDDDKPLDEEPFARLPYVRRGVRGRIKELGIDRYILDDKLEFEWTGHEWKCLSCSSAHLVRQRLIEHLISATCTGLASPSSVEVLEHIGFKYDKLMEDLFECRRCPFTSKSSAEMKNHINESHYQRPRPRNTCKLSKTASFAQQGSSSNVFLINNKHRVTWNIGRYSCELCSYSTVSKNLIILHVQRHHGTRMSRSLISIQKIGQNKYSLGDFPFERLIDKFKCGSCDYSHKSVNKIREHIRFEHIKDISKHACELCGYSTLIKSNLDDHLKTHQNERPFLCDVCGKSFKTRGNERQHRLLMHQSHLVSKNILCEQCGQKFSCQSRLKLHLKTHNNVTCQICGKDYNEAYLKVHLQSHKNGGKKLAECGDCGKKFKTRNGLDVHRKSCSGDRPYSCDICGMKFTQIYNVTRHKKVIHDPNKITKTVARKQPKLRREVKP